MKVNTALKLKAILECLTPVFSVGFDPTALKFRILVNREEAAEIVKRFLCVANEFGRPEISRGPRFEGKDYWQVIAVADSTDTIERLNAA